MYIMRKLFIMAVLALCAGTVDAKDIRIVEISTGGSVGSSNYESSAKSILSTLSAVSNVVASVTDLILTVTYDADQVSVDDIVSKLNKEEPRFEAKQKSEPKTKALVKAEKKLEKAEKKVAAEREQMGSRDQQREQKQDQPQQDKGKK